MRRLLGWWRINLLICWSVLTACSNPQSPRPNFTTIDGRVIAPQDYQGQVVLLNFWATSCHTCVKEMPQLMETHLKYREQGLRTIAVAMQYDNINHVLNFTQSRQLPFDVVFDTDGHLAKTFEQVSLTPTWFLINRQGQIIQMHVGKANFAQLHADIEGAL